MIIKLLNEHHLEFLSLKGGCRGWSESTLVKMPHCWKSHVAAQIHYSLICILSILYDLAHYVEAIFKQLTAYRNNVLNMTDTPARKATVIWESLIFLMG